MSVSAQDAEHDEAQRRITGASTALLRRGFISATYSLFASGECVMGSNIGRL